MRSTTNRDAMRRWYLKQKPSVGSVYMITCRANGWRYIGYTTNSLKKRLWQFLSSNHAKVQEHKAKYGADSFIIEELKQVFNKEDLRKEAEILIQDFMPEYNIKKDYGHV